MERTFILLLVSNFPNSTECENRRSVEGSISLILLVIQITLWLCPSMSR